MSKSYKYDADQQASELKKKRRQTRRVNEEFKDCETMHWHHTKTHHTRNKLTK